MHKSIQIDGNRRESFRISKNHIQNTTNFTIFIITYLLGWKLSHVAFLTLS